MVPQPPCFHVPASFASLVDEPAWAPVLSRILAIGGSDSSGGAGVQADSQAIAANGGRPVMAITAVTAQHSRGVTASFPLAPEAVGAQLDAAYADAMPAVVKTGMLVSGATVDFLVRRFRHTPPPILVVDPVMRSSSGATLLDKAGTEALRARLLPLATLVTPNIPEVEALVGIEVRTLADAGTAGRRILAMGAQAVLVKGGHLGSSRGTDVLVTADGVSTFEGIPMAGRDVHGTGCAYVSAISTHLAHGCALEESIRIAKGYIEALIATAVQVGPGALMADHSAAAQLAWGHVR